MLYYMLITDSNGRVVREEHNAEITALVNSWLNLPNTEREDYSLIIRTARA